MSATLMTPPLAKTPLHDWHVAHRGRMVDFAGWSMPVQYESIVAEHEAVRKAVGLFDISHMGRLTFAGAGADRVSRWLAHSPRQRHAARADSL